MEITMGYAKRKIEELEVELTEVKDRLTRVEAEYLSFVLEPTDIESSSKERK